MKRYYEICEYVESEDEKHSYVVLLDETQLEVMHQKIERHNLEYQKSEHPCYDYMDASKIEITPYKYDYLGSFAMDMINNYSNNNWRKRVGYYSLVENWEDKDMYRGKIFCEETNIPDENDKAPFDEFEELAMELANRKMFIANGDECRVRSHEDYIRYLAKNL